MSFNNLAKNGLKICGKCKKEKSVSEFHKDNKRPDKLVIYCKTCVRAQQDAYTKNGRCTRCGQPIVNRIKKTCENCRNIWGYNFTLVKKDEIPEQAGNYVIYFPSTKSVYIGATCNLKQRISGHFRQLSKGKHPNKLVQKEYNTIEHIQYILIGINLCDKYDIYKNEVKIFNILQEKNFNILSQSIGKLRLYQFSNQRIKTLYSKIVKLDNGCWHYNGYIGKDGYNYIQVDKQYFAVHRIVYTIHHRKKLQDPTWEIPQHLLLRHLCHNKRCCNPDHLVVGTDQDNALDNKGRPKKRRSNCGQLVTAWGETKHISEWMVDPRKLPELQVTTINARLSKMSPEDALTKPLYRKRLTEEEKKHRLQKRILKEQSNNQKFQTAATIRTLHAEGEHIDDLIEFFNWLKPTYIKNIIAKRKWYNPSIEAVIPKNYIRLKRNICPSVIPDGLFWENGYYSAHVKINKSYVSSGKYKTPEEALRMKYQLEKFGKDS